MPSSSSRCGRPASRPGWIPSHPALRAGFDAIERATGVRPLAVRSGGSIPVAAAFTARGIPTVLSGFGIDADNIHSPDERLEIRRFEWALRSAREMLPGPVRVVTNLDSRGFTPSQVAG